MQETILILVSTLGGGGAERRALMTAKGLMNDYNVKIVIFDSSFTVYEVPCDIIDLNVPISNSYFLKFIQQFIRAKKIKQLRKHEKPIAVISFGPAVNRANCFSYGVGKTIVSLTSYPQAQKNLVNGFIFSIANKIICQTIAMKKKFLEGYPNLAQKVTTINNGFDIENIKEQAHREIDEVEHGSRYADFVSIGRLESIKGYKHLLCAFSMVLKELPTVTLSILGEGYLREKLESYTKFLGIEKSVSFLGFLENPFAIISRCRVCVLTSIREGFPNSLVEAMVCGIPVIATDCKSGPREILSERYQEKSIEKIEYEDYGILVPPFISDDSNEPEKDQMLAEAMYIMLSDNVLRTKYAELAKQRANDFSLERYIESIKRLID